MNKDNVAFRFKCRVERICKEVDKCHGGVIFPIAYFFSLITFFIFAVLAKKYYVSEITDLSFVVGPIIAGLIAFLVGENNRENEIIKLREKWLSEVKQKISQYMARVESFYRVVVTIARSSKPLNGLSEVTPGDFKKSAKNKEVHDLYSLILDDKSFLLYTLRSTEGSEAGINEQIQRAHKKLSMFANKCNIGEMTYNDYKEHRKEFLDRVSKSMLDISSIYFQEEWARIKKGSLAIRIKRLLCFWVVGMLLGVYVGVALNNVSIERYKKSYNGPYTNCVPYNSSCKGFLIFK